MYNGWTPDNPKNEGWRAGGRHLDDCESEHCCTHPHLKDGRCIICGEEVFATTASIPSAEFDTSDTDEEPE